MSMGSMASFAEVFSEDKLKEICPEEYKDFINGLVDCYANTNEEEEAPEVYLSWFVTEVKNEDIEDEDFEKLLGFFEKLQEAFNEKTGLDLDVEYHSSDDCGDCYDEVDGIFWTVGNVYKMTPEALALKDSIERKFFVVWG